MDIKILKRTGNLLQLQVTITQLPSEPEKEFTSPKFLCGTVYFQLQVHSARCLSVRSSAVNGSYIIAARYLNAMENDNLSYKCDVTYSIGSIGLFLLDLASTESVHETTCTSTVNWHHILKHSTTYKKDENLDLSFSIIVKFNTATSVTPFASLYEDTELTDFDLKGEGGSVAVHSAVLAGVSPVLKNMLTGNWQETLNRSVTIADATKETLEHFKEYIYLDKLPETGLKELLLLGSCYLMPDLVQKCIFKLLCTTDCNNIIDLVEFASEHKVKNLLAAILKMVHNQAIDVDKLAVVSSTFLKE